MTSPKLAFTYSDYAVDYIDYEDDFIESWRRFIPDQFLSCLEDLLPRMDGYWSAYERANAQGTMPNLFTGKRRRKPGSNPDYVLIREPSMDWDTSIQLATDGIEEFDADMGARVRRVVDNGWLEPTRAANNEGTTGYCDWSYPAGKDFHSRVATIGIARTRTIADAASLVHEAGHFLAGDYADVPCPPPSSRSRRSKIVAEIQSFFLEESFQDEALHPSRTPQIVRAISYHRHACALLVSDRIRSDFNYFWDARRAQALKRQKKLRKGAVAYCGLHMTPYWTALFLGAGIYGRYRAMDAAEQKTLIRLIYPIGVNAVSEETENGSLLLRWLERVAVDDMPSLCALFSEAADLRLNPDFSVRARLALVD